MNTKEKWIRIHQVMELCNYRNYQYFYTLRKGYNGKGAKRKAILIENEDWVKNDGVVMYNKESIKKLVKSRTTNKHKVYVIDNNRAMRILNKSEKTMNIYRNGRKDRNIEPILKKDVDWNKIGGKVLYNVKAIEKLKSKMV